MCLLRNIYELFSGFRSSVRTNGFRVGGHTQGTHCGFSLPIEFVHINTIKKHVENCFYEMLLKT